MAPKMPNETNRDRVKRALLARGRSSESGAALLIATVDHIEALYARLSAQAKGAGQPSLEEADELVTLVELAVRNLLRPD
jgi:hypothetical protein